ncbi:MAG: hypothetical protein EAX87_08695 [Candidatus Thorarchaeota archaeon]|nr:hypothetical protein [Candidatus Thorarchaeota archaeon]
MEPESNEDEGYDWSSLKPSTHDDFQKYVLLAHIVLGFIISVFSFSDGWFSWGVGTGLLPPLLLAVTGGVYVIHVGINWYRDEFIPYITRTQTFPEFETERFLKYQRIHRVLILISGYIALVITQYIWTQIANFLTPIVSDQSLLIQILSYILLGMVIVDLVILIIIFVIFESRLKLAFSDVGFILDIEEKRQQYDREKKKEEKEERERQKKKSLKKGKANKSESAGNSSQSSEEQE